MSKKITFQIIAAILIIAAFTCCNQMKQQNGQNDKEAIARTDFNGNWKLIPDSGKSTLIELYNALSIQITIKNSGLSMIQKFGNGASAHSDTFNLKMDGTPVDIPVHSRIFPTHPFLGLKMPVGDKKTVKAWWEGSVLKIDETYNVLGSQGPSPVTAHHTFELTDHKELLAYTINRSTRSGSEIKYLLKKEGNKEAWFMNLKDGWNISGGLPENAFLITLQGLANSNGANLYFVYPDTWDFNYTKGIFKFYKDKKNYTFTELKSANDALRVFKDKIKGYIVWDKNVRSSLIVAFTAAGIENAVVVSEDMIPMVEKAGLTKLEDFRGTFANKTDLQIFEWAYDKYWEQCSKETIIWMGGESGDIMKPGIADWGVYKKAFFTNLCTSKKDTTGEYKFAYKLMSELKPMSLIMGWHSYSKDLERDYTTLASMFGHKVEGLHTLPNISFNSQVKVSPGFRYKNHHNVVPGRNYIPENKVYMTCIQSDGLGLGAWVKPGRGEIPYAWECMINYEWMAPSILEFYYSEATPNDYFLGCLSGPGYMYPKAMPDEYLVPNLKEASRLMNLLDLDAFETMDYSEGATVTGNTEITKREIDAYYKAMPNCIGFVNGYSPSHTFTSRNGIPFLSFDYYLSPDVLPSEAVADLRELAAINTKRPYFLTIHVREYSDIKRVKGILDKLPQEFELLPLDLFLKYAGNKPTFKENILKESKVDHSLPVVNYKGKAGR